MTKLEKIKDILRNYKKEADKEFEQFAKEEQRCRERYSEETFKHEMKTRIFPTAVGSLNGDREIAIINANVIFDEVEEEFTNWVTKPLDYSTAQTMDYINKFDLSLSLPELRAIEKKVTEGYFGQKIFRKIAEKSGYMVSNIPTMDECMDALERARKETKFALEAYAGEPPFLGREMIGDHIWNGISQGRYTTNHHIIALNKLKNTGDINELEEILQRTKAPIEYELSPDERKAISSKIKKIMVNGAINQETATELLKEDPNFVGKLESFLDEEDGRGYSKEHEDKETLEKYFQIGIYKPDSNYKITKVQKPEDSPNRGKVNEELLNQYK